MRGAAAAFRNHCDAWNAGDRDRWLTLFAPDIRLEDPVGGPEKQGRGALEKTWDVSHTADRSWRLQPRRIVECGREAAIDLVNIGTLDGKTVEIQSIEIWKVDDAGLVTHLRVFFDADPEVHHEHYLPQDP